MTLATLPRSTPLRPSPGRAKVAAAAAALQQAIDDLYREDREREAERERNRQRNAAETERLVRLGKARLATRKLKVEVPAKFFWDFAAEALDAMRELAREAKQHGQQMRAQGIEARIDAMCGELDRIQKREAGTSQ